jgi:hypothetical protein
MYRGESNRVLRKRRLLGDSVSQPYRHSFLPNRHASFLSFLQLVKPVSAKLSLVAMLFSLAGCTIRVLGPLHLVPFHLHRPVLLGVYCFLIGYLIFRSTFLPRILGALMAISGLGGLTFVSRQLATQFSPYQ